jgi:hypothetical protein
MRSYRWLGIVVAALQVLAVVSLVAVHYFCHNPSFLVRYYGPARSIILKENLPLVIALAPFAYGLELFGGLPSPIRGACLAIGTTLFGLALLPSVGLFWYFIVTELTMRTRGSSKLRFRSLIAESVVLVVLFVMGAGTVLYAISDRASWQHVASGRIDATLGNVFLLMWGIAFFTISVVDFRWLLTRDSADKLAVGPRAGGAP